MAKQKKVKSKKAFQKERVGAENRMRQATRKMERAASQVKHVTRSEVDMVKLVMKAIPIDSQTSSFPSALRMVVFTNNETFKVQEFPILRSYLDKEDGMVVILDPNGKAKQRVFGKSDYVGRKE